MKWRLLGGKEGGGWGAYFKEVNVHFLRYAGWRGDFVSPGAICEELSSLRVNYNLLTSHHSQALDESPFYLLPITSQDFANANQEASAIVHDHHFLS